MGFRTTERLTVCPSCGELQHALIAALDPYGGGVPYKVRCKYCRALYTFADNMPEGANKGKSKYANKEAARTAAANRRRSNRNRQRETELQRVRRRTDPERFRKMAREYAQRPEAKARRKEYVAANRERLNAAKRDWRTRNRARVKLQEMRSNERWLAAMQADPEHPKHGTKRGYKHGCRCDRCRKAMSDYQRDYRERKKREVGAS